MTESEPQNRHLGYARVSTYGQTLDAPIAKLQDQTDMRRGADRLSWFLTCHHNVLRWSASCWSRREHGEGSSGGRHRGNWCWGGRYRCCPPSRRRGILPHIGGS